MLFRSKKVLIANNVGLLWKMISSEQVQNPSVLLFWLGIIAYTFQIYYDFSGYSDMAIGLARIFGLTFDENFNFPYIAKSITEFWRRWHITLSSWFRDYVYIPLGGNRCSKLRNIFNLLVVWGLTGFWHGASWNFLIWGLYFAVILILEKFVLGQYLKKLPSFLQHIYALLLIMISWVIFYFDDFHNVLNYLGGMFGLNGMPFCNSQALYYLLSYGLIFIIAGYLSTPHFKKAITYAENSKKTSVAAFATISYCAIFIACIVYLVNSTYNPFLYFRF